jgi:hypothetical protein
MLKLAHWITLLFSIESLNSQLSSETKLLIITSKEQQEIVSGKILLW